MRPNRLTIAMGISAAIHATAFVVADWMLGDDSLPSMTTTILAVNVEPPVSEGEVPDESRVVPLMDSLEAAETMDHEVVPVEEQFVGAVEGPPPVASSPAIEIAELPEVSAARIEIVSSTESIRPVPPYMALKPEDEEMLSRKVSEMLHEMPEDISALTWSDEGQEYHATITQLPVKDDMGIERVVVEISTEEDGKQLTSEVQMKRLAFSSYAQFVNEWDPDVLVHDDELDGRFHSNTEIRLDIGRDAKPVFRGKVTTASRRVEFTKLRDRKKRDEIFLGGLQTGVKSIRLPSRFLPFPGQATVTGENVHRMTEDTRIVFSADGTYTWQPVDGEVPSKVTAISPHTSYLVATRHVKLFVKGTVNGKVLVYSPERIVIEGNLFYAQDPETIPGSDDYLGLVSDKNVEIARTKVTGPGDLYVNAAIYAKRRFVVRGYRTSGHAVLQVYGSVSSGSVSATEPRYSTRIRFDKRFEEMRPPGFPMTDRYEVESWTAGWNVISEE
ncbi:MAG: hypothetical protein KJO09_07355 [Gammaproteobacteria bacterium]|nr:hypothetical protein [Gammaproteobacteria bacterium]